MLGIAVSTLLCCRYVWCHLSAYFTIYIINNLYPSLRIMHGHKYVINTGWFNASMVTCQFLVVFPVIWSCINEQYCYLPFFCRICCTFWNVTDPLSILIQRFYETSVFLLVSWLFSSLSISIITSPFLPPNLSFYLYCYLGIRYCIAFALCWTLLCHIYTNRWLYTGGISTVNLYKWCHANDNRIYALGHSKPVYGYE